MSSRSVSDRRSFPTRIAYDPRAERLEIAVDAVSVGVEDLAVAAGPGRVRIRIDHDDGTSERSVAPPTRRHAFDEEREAVYNNGVLTVSVGTTRRDGR